MKRVLERRYHVSAFELWVLTILSVVLGALWVLVLLAPFLSR